MGRDQDPGSGATDGEVSLDQFLEGSMDLLAVLDFATTPLVLSRSWERLLGWTREELMDRAFIELVHPDDLAFASSELGTLLTGEPTNPSDIRLLAQDGTYRWIQASASSVVASQRIYLTATDIAARKALETALQRQMALEELVASIAPSLIAAEPEDLSAVIRTAIGELASSLGADRAHFLRAGRTAEDSTYVEWRHPEYGLSAHQPDASETVQSWWRDLLRSEELLVLEDVEDLAEEAPEVVASLREDGVKSVLLVPLPRQRRYWAFLSFVAIRDRVEFTPATTHLLRLSGEAFLAALAQGDSAVALRDARAELEHRNDSLERSNADLERFAEAAAHDLKNPLARIEMALQAVGSKVGDPESQMLAIARRGSTRLRQLIEDLLEYSKMTQVSGRGEPVDLDSAVAEAMAMQDTAEVDPVDHVTIAPLPEVIGHRVLLVQLFHNLIANALKFHRDGVPSRVTVSAEVSPDGVLLTVADNGIGIPEESRADVFEPFRRLHSDDRFAGTGIGLATCSRVADVHGGRIWVDDGIDGGTAIKVWLPPDRLPSR